MLVASNTLTKITVKCTMQLTSKLLTYRTISHFITPPTSLFCSFNFFCTDLFLEELAALGFMRSNTA